MSQITSDLVKQLRERTGAGMMDCKKALQATEGDIEQAVEHLRKEGLAKAAKKESRQAIEGTIVTYVDSSGKEAVMLEINSETDFVGKEDNFKQFASHIAQRALETKAADADELENQPFEQDGEQTINEARKELIAKLGENIQITRLARAETESGCVSSYVHGGRVGALVRIDTDDQQLARDLAMHITASQPVALRPEDVPEEEVEKEKSIRRSQAEASGTPEHVIDKKVTGQVEKFKKESSLLGQPFVKDPKTSVEELLEQKGASVENFERFALGEGREAEKEKDFAQEVKEQVESHKHDK